MNKEINKILIKNPKIFAPRPIYHNDHYLIQLGQFLCDFSPKDILQDLEDPNAKGYLGNMMEFSLSKKRVIISEFC